MIASQPNHPELYHQSTIREALYQAERVFGKSDAPVTLLSVNETEGAERVRLEVAFAALKRAGYPVTIVEGTEVKPVGGGYVTDETTLVPVCSLVLNPETMQSLQFPDRKGLRRIA